jgi:hypothetical protein
MKLAGWVAIAVAVLLLGAVFVQWRNDTEAAAERIQRGFAEISAGDSAALDADSARADAERNMWTIEGIAGAGFLVAGLVMLRKRTA